MTSPKEDENDKVLLIMNTVAVISFIIIVVGLVVMYFNLN